MRRNAGNWKDSLAACKGMVGAGVVRRTFVRFLLRILPTPVFLVGRRLTVVTIVNTFFSLMVGPGGVASFPRSRKVNESNDNDKDVSS